jgi:hypothetical protein
MKNGCGETSFYGNKRLFGSQNARFIRYRRQKLLAMGVTTCPSAVFSMSGYPLMGHDTARN